MNERLFKLVSTTTTTAINTGTTQNGGNGLGYDTKGGMTTGPLDTKTVEEDGKHR